MKTPVSTSIDTDTFNRIETLARVDSRSRAQILTQAIQRGLTILEAEHATKAQALREQPSPYNVRHAKKLAA